MELTVTERGSGERLVVFVHGVLDRGRSFTAVADALESECRMLLYDRRGYGDAIVDGATPIGVADHVDDVLAILDGRRAVVVGHSFGGITAMATAIRAPQLVEAVVLYETALAWAPGWDDHVMQEVLASDQPYDAALRLMLGDRIDAMTDEQRARRYRQAAAFLGEERSVRTGAPPFDVARIGCPVFYGTSDPDVLAAVIDHLVAEVPGTEVVLLPGAGHHAHRDDPAGFASLVRRALAVTAG